MGRMKSLLIVQEEELEDLKKQYANLEEELAFLEHEKYSLSRRIALVQEELDDKELEIYNHLTAIEETIRREKDYDDNRDKKEIQ